MKLQKSAPSRIVIVSSLAHKWRRMNWDDLFHEKKYDATGAYAMSKLANIFHCIELSRRLEGEEIGFPFLCFIFILLSL